ncbi:MAG TPA: mandelate racemase/muconate lactonizing enzyme family protein [Nakamurella sp.]|jgi:L-alanine-DL-glutamate epimerase-like enolase superfamily enzyme|nr:mandelate racemase/muconate lactonizing enzyme family protein [Nakamurella sp.]
MSDIKITDVEAVYLRMPSIKERTDSSQDALVVRITTDAGIVGYGEVDSSPMIAKAIIEAPPSHTRSQGLRGLLIGENPLETSRLWQRMREATLYIGRNGAVIQAMAGIDLALWDIKGKYLSRPVSELLGATYRDRLRAYASHMFEFSPEATGRRAAEAADEGFTAVKFGWEPLGQDPALDVKLVAAVRSAVGEDVAVMIDAGLAWDAKTAISRCHLFEPYGLYWLEEPLHPDDLRGYARLGAAVDTRIAAGEEECTAGGFVRLMDEGRIDVVQIDVTRVGLTEAVRIAGLANDRGIPVANHNFTTDINTAASLHFLAAVPNSLILEYCVEDNPMRKRLVRNPIRLEDGYAVVPTEPGLGVDVDLDAVSEFVVG